MRSDNYIYFISNNIGGAVCLIPLIKYFVKKNKKIILVYNYKNSNYFKNFNSLKFSLKKTLSSEEIQNIYNKYFPKFIFTSTTYPNDPILGDIENKFVYIGKKNNIKTYCFVDHWCGYKERFTSKINKKNILVKPNHIFVSDSKAKNELLKSIDNSDINLSITGNPSWDELKNKKLINDYSFLQNKKIDNTKKNILFISEVISEEKNMINYDFNEFQVLDNIIEKLSKTHNIIIKRHPRENQKKYNYLNYKKYKNKNVIILDNQTNLFNILFCFNIIIGMTSTLLIELKLLGINTVISFQPTKNNKPIIDFGFGIKNISSLKDIEKSIQKRELKYKYHFKALDKILKIIN